MATPPCAVASGDRAVFLGIGQLRGKHCDVIAARPGCTSVRFDTGLCVLAPSVDLHPIPRRPPPDF